MIGVISSADEVPIVQEFFQLLKTPWEFYQHGQAYDVVLATTDEIQPGKTKLLLTYGSEIMSSDLCKGIAARSRCQGGRLNYDGNLLPVYGQLLTFEEKTGGTASVTTDSGIAGLKISFADSTVMRLGYDLFREVQFLLSVGQPVENAHIPALEVHIMMLRTWIIDAGVAFAEIPPAPAGYSLIVCLTHDIDFIGIRSHRFDHSMWGFLYRSTVGASRNFLRQRISIARLLESWRAAASLPFVYLGWAKDFWIPFDWYLRVEKNLPATYFLIPFRNRPGQKVSAPHPSRRASAYDITDIPRWTATLMKEGHELGVHGIDAWHSVEKGRDELTRVAAVTGASEIGVRMHWLLRNDTTFRVLEQAGYDYDSSVGYNETVGYRSGTTQTFRPLGVQQLLELPIHIQDGALFYPQRLDLSEREAWQRCTDLIENARKYGGVLTVLWHDRSHAAERFWGDFYARLLQALRSIDAWFATARRVVAWFRKRREIRFDRAEAADGIIRTVLSYNGEKIVPPAIVRVHYAGARRNAQESPTGTVPNVVDIPWDGETTVQLHELLQNVPESSAKSGFRRSPSQPEIRLP